MCVVESGWCRLLLFIQQKDPRKLGDQDEIMKKFDVNPVIRILEGAKMNVSPGDGDAN